MNATVLLVDDDQSLVRLLTHWLSAAGHRVQQANSGEQALHLLSTTLPDLVLLDVNLPGDKGDRVLEQIKLTHPHLPVIMLTAETDVSSVVSAMQAGAWDYLAKPVHRTKLVTTVRNAAEKAHADLRLMQLERDLGGAGYPGIVGSSPVMQDMFRQLDRVGPSDITVLVHGESGTGKELVASALHQASGRRDAPFVALNCAAIPENLQESELFGHEKGTFTGASQRRIGRFEQADCGTLFLDEVGELSLTLQAKLLRVLQERRFYRVGGDTELAVDVRIVAATNRDIAEQVRLGAFRQDLYFRLAVYELAVPPLRTRGDDLMVLAGVFLRAVAERMGERAPTLSEAAKASMRGWHWPGNVRELQNAMERVAVIARDGVVQARDLPPRMLQGHPAPSGPAPSPDYASGDQTPMAAGSAPGTLAQIEEQAIQDSLRATSGNVSEVARKLGIPRSTLYRRLRGMGLR
ncbi:MAG: DNA-binding NtrC family response regulator [Kiritimatiellia bacterium]|jgi:DNA-binding NtrC family response regulator